MAGFGSVLEEISAFIVTAYPLGLFSRQRKRDRKMLVLSLISPWNN